VIPSTKTKYRPDLEGLRAIAVLLVVFYHAGFTQVPGGFIGVDIFFVLSGYFISQQLWSNLEQYGKVSMADFYSRRIRRILPAASVVIVVTAALSWLLLSPVYASEIGWDAIAAALNIANIRFATISNDYFDNAVASSPFIHFWSLGVEEQFYIFWPLLFLLVGLLLKRSNKSSFAKVARIIIVAVMTVATLGSLAFSIYQTGTNQIDAFYLLPSRAWELGIGGLIAVSQGKYLPKKWLSNTISVLALGILTFVVVTYNNSTVFPGLGAVLPVVATALLVFAGSTQTFVARVLSVNPLRAIGRWSFSLYLWHWPILVFLDEKLGTQNNIRIKLFAMVLALILAAATYAFLENPVRFSPRLRKSAAATFKFGLAALLLGALAGAPMVAQAALSGTEAINVASDIRSVTLAMKQGLEPHALPPDLTPSLSNAKDTSRSLTVTSHCMVDFGDQSFPKCIFGNPRSKFTIWLVGDSHANQWFQALLPIVEKYRLRLVVHARARCPIVDELLVGSISSQSQQESCYSWTGKVLRAMRLDSPDLVLAAASTPISSAHKNAYVRSAKQMTRYTRNLLVLGDTPHALFDPPTCVAAHANDASYCKLNRVAGGGMDIPKLEAGVGKAVKAAGITYLPTSDWVCVNQLCPAVVGNVLIYRDVSHLTEQGSKLFSPFMERALLPYLPRP
jgi:peptidoglycan/LPS O-acetylase OafA/YrhL